MKNKVLIVLATMFISQMFFSCWPCDCSPSETFENNYIDISITPYDTSWMLKFCLVKQQAK